MTRHNEKAPATARRNKPALPLKDERLTRREVKSFTRLDNALVKEIFPHMGKTEMAVVIAAIRKIEGWNKTQDAISLTQFSADTGLSINSVREGIAAAVARGVLIEVAPATRKRAAIYRLAYPALESDEQTVIAPAAPLQRMTHDETVAALKEHYFDSGTALDERGRVITAQRIGREAKELRKLLPDCTPEEIANSAAWYVKDDGIYLQVFDSDNVCELPHTARKIAHVVKDYRGAYLTPYGIRVRILEREGTLTDERTAELVQDFQAWCEKHKPEVPIAVSTFNGLWDEYIAKQPPPVSAGKQPPPVSAGEQQSPGTPATAATIASDEQQPAADELPPIDVDEIPF